MAKPQGKHPLNQALVNDLCNLIRTSPFTEDQIKQVYTAASMRVTHKVCRLCRKIKPVPELARNAVDGDIRNVGWECKDGCGR